MRESLSITVGLNSFNDYLSVDSLLSGLLPTSSPYSTDSARFKVSLLSHRTTGPPRNDACFSDCHQRCVTHPHVSSEAMLTHLKVAGDDANVGWLATAFASWSRALGVRISSALRCLSFQSV